MTVLTTENVDLTWLKPKQNVEFTKKKVGFDHLYGIVWRFPEVEDPENSPGSVT